MLKLMSLYFIHETLGTKPFSCQRDKLEGRLTAQTLPKRLRVKPCPYLPLGLLEAAGDEEERGIGQQLDHHAGTWDQSLRSAGQPRGTGHPAGSGGDEPVLAPRSLPPLLTSVFPSPTKSFPCLIDTGASTLPNGEDSARVCLPLLERFLHLFPSASVSPNKPTCAVTNVHSCFLGSSPAPKLQEAWI